MDSSKLSPAEQIAGLRRQLRFLQVAVILLVVGFVAFWATINGPTISAAEHQEKEIKCERLTAKRITVIDDKGKPRIQATLSDGGVPYLGIYNVDGSTCMEVSAAPDHTSMQFAASDGRQVQLGIHKKQSYLALGHAKKGEHAYGIKLIDTKGGPLIALKDHDDAGGQDRIAIGRVGKKYDIQIDR